jgi:hypothetical protein
MLGDERRARRYRRAIEVVLRDVMELQCTVDDADYHERPERVVGGFLTSVERPQIRIDAVHHVLDCYGVVLRVFGSERRRSAEAS